MHLSKVTLKRNYSINPFTHEHLHLGAEVDLNVGEDPMEGLRSASKLVHEYYLEEKGKIESMMGTQVRDIVEERSKDPRQAMMDDILACTELEGADGLLSFRKLSENDAEIKAVYDLQLLKLKK